MEKPLNKMSKDELRDYLNTPEGRTIMEDIKKIMTSKNSERTIKLINKIDKK